MCNKRRLSFWAILVMFLAFGCQEKFIVLSSHTAYHPRSQKVYYMEIDTSLYLYDQFKSELPVVASIKRKPLRLDKLIKYFKATVPPDSVYQINKYSKNPVKISEAPK